MKNVLAGKILVKTTMLKTTQLSVCMFSLVWSTCANPRSSDLLEGVYIFPVLSWSVSESGNPHCVGVSKPCDTFHLSVWRTWLDVCAGPERECIHKLSLNEHVNVFKREQVPITLKLDKLIWTSFHNTLQFVFFGQPFIDGKRDDAISSQCTCCNFFTPVFLSCLNWQITYTWHVECITRMEF